MSKVDLSLLGGAWKNEAMQNIRAYLKEEIDNIQNENLDFIVIA